MYKNSGNLLIYQCSVTEAQLRKMLSLVITPERICVAFELVDRNRITSNPQKIIKESRLRRLRAFRFLINRN